MPVDVTNLIDAMQSGVRQIPPIAIAIALLAGPTAALIVHRLIGATSHLQDADELEDAAPMWVCKECRSINALRQPRCYRCSAQRDAAREIELIVDRPTRMPTPFEVPMGSPLASLDPGTPVMGPPSQPTDGVAVGPGRPIEAIPAAAAAAQHPDEPYEADLGPAVERPR